MDQTSNVNHYIAYFDLLGFKNFILNNSHALVKSRILKNLNADLALSQGKTIRTANGAAMLDLSLNTVNYLNISDTVIFWTKDSTIQSLLEILEVTYSFNLHGVLDFFPLRGTLIYGEFETLPFDYNNTLNATYRINPIFGKGLIHAHIKAENLNWAGSVIDETVVNILIDQGYDPDKFLEKYAVKYPVPYKKAPCKNKPEYAFKLSDRPLDKEALSNWKLSITRNFASDNKDASSRRAKTILKNTISFLSSVKSTNPRSG